MQLSQSDSALAQHAAAVKDVQNLCIANRAITLTSIEYLGFDETDALEYLYQRGSNNRTIELFQLGYIPSDMTQFISTLDFTIDSYDIQKTGLLLKSTDESGIIDFQVSAAHSIH